MTPKEKAIEMLDEFVDYVNCWDDNGNCNYEQAYNYAKKCALISINCILEIGINVNATVESIAYWKEVKQEIKNL